VTSCTKTAVLTSSSGKAKASVHTTVGSSLQDKQYSVGSGSMPRQVCLLLARFAEVANLLPELVHVRHF